MKKRFVLSPLVALGAVMGVSHAQNAAPATPKSDFETEAAKVLDGFNPAAPRAASAPVAFQVPAASKPAALALPPVSGLPPARPIFQKDEFNLTTDRLEGKLVSESSLLYPVIDENNEIDDDGLPNINLVSDNKQVWTGNYGYGVRAAQLRLGLNLLVGKPKPKLGPNAEIFWLLAPSDWGQMVVDANKALEANPNDALALAKRAAGWRFAYQLDLLDLLPANARSVDAGRELYNDRMRSDLEAMFKLPPVREAMPYVLAALRVNQWEPSADDVRKGSSNVKATLDKLQLLNKAYAFFTPVAPEAVAGRVELYGQSALAMHLEGDPNAPKQAAAVEFIAAQVLAKQPKSPLALWRFVVANPDAKPDDAKTVFAGIGDKSEGADTAARIAQLFWSVPGQFARGAAWANFAFEMAGPNASPLVKWVKARATSAGAVRFAVPREVAFGLSFFEADKVEALEMLAQGAGERGEWTLARRALEEAIGVGAPPRFWMLLSSAAEAEANAKTGQEAEDLWVEALNANRIATRYQFPGDQRLRSEMGTNNALNSDGLTANTDKPGELDPLPARYAEPSPLVAARLHGAWLLLRAERVPDGVYAFLETSWAFELNANRIVEKDGERTYQLAVGAQSAIALHRRFVRAQLERIPDIEETSRGTTVPIKFNRKKVLQKYLEDLIKMSGNYAPTK